MDFIGNKIFNFKGVGGNIDLGKYKVKDYQKITLMGVASPDSEMTVSFNWINNYEEEFGVTTNFVVSVNNNIIETNVNAPNVRIVLNLVENVEYFFVLKFNKE